jgi:hypothetical protein
MSTNINRVHTDSLLPYFYDCNHLLFDPSLGLDTPKAIRTSLAVCGSWVILGASRVFTTIITKENSRMA